jgi:hypothetical protein
MGALWSTPADDGTDKDNDEFSAFEPEDATRVASTTATATATANAAFAIGIVIDASADRVASIDTTSVTLPCRITFNVDDIQRQRRQLRSRNSSLSSDSPLPISTSTLPVEPSITTPPTVTINVVADTYAALLNNCELRERIKRRRRHIDGGALDD